MRHARILVSDVLDGLAQLPDESAQCVITSPPYWGLRDYGCEGQIGIELNPTYAGMAEKRIRDSAPLLNTIEVSTEAAPTSKGKEETLPKTVRS